MTINRRDFIKAQAVAAAAEGDDLMLEHQLAVDGVDCQVGLFEGGEIERRGTEGVGRKTRHVIGAHQPPIDDFEDEIIGVSRSGRALQGLGFEKPAMLYESAGEAAQRGLRSG